jgi:hypothetical protein
VQRPRGSVNLVSLTLLVVAVSGAYLAWIWVPLWLDDLDVREALAAGVGQLGTEVTSLDAGGVQRVVAGRLRNVGSHWEEHDGKQVEVPGLGVEPDDVKVEREGRTVRLTVDYDRTVKLKPLERYQTFHFHTTREGTVR